MSSISPNTVLFKEGDEAQGKEFAKEKVNFVKHDFGSFDESIPDLEEEPEELYADVVTEHPGMRVFEWFEVRIFEQPRLTWGQQWMPYNGLLEVFVDLFDEMYHNVYMQELVMDLLPYVSTRDIIGISRVLDESIVPIFCKKFYYMAILYSGIEVERFDQAQTVSFLRWCLNEWRTPFNHSVLACVMQSVLAWRYAINPMRSIADLATPQGQNVVRLTEEEVGLIPADSFWHYIFRDVVTEYDGDEIAFDEDGYYIMEYSYKIPDKYVSFESNVTTIPSRRNMSVVAFVSRFDDTKTECEVYNATRVVFTPDSYKSVEENISDNGNVTFHAENGSIVASAELNDMAVYSISGARVENKALNGGIYIVKGVDAEGNSVVAKVLVK